MYGFSIGKQNYSEVPPVHFLDRRPKANSSVLLNYLSHWMLNYIADPLQVDHGTVRPLSHFLKISGELQASVLANILPEQNDAVSHQGSLTSTGGFMNSHRGYHVNRPTGVNMRYRLQGNDLLHINRNNSLNLPRPYLEAGGVDDRAVATAGAAAHSD